MSDDGEINTERIRQEIYSDVDAFWSATVCGNERVPFISTLIMLHDLLAKILRKSLNLDVCLCVCAVVVRWYSVVLITFYIELASKLRLNDTCRTE